ncbi:hypothetical protein U1769_14380 [Sphingomonas sp. ZT3P38]|uniref:hypothetical protein n=1 Tax=Parasphingomonas zepuensis TaxID=3096161 RepID=UPI002FC79074
MARVSADLRLQDRSARTRLRVRQNPYWRMVCEGQHLGYYKGARGGTWIARYRPPGTDGNGSKQSLGVADDFGDANGETILNWKQALDRAMHWFELQEKGGTETALNPDITVADAVQAYIAIRNKRRASQAGREVQSEAAGGLTRHVLGTGDSQGSPSQGSPKPTSRHGRKEPCDVAPPSSASSTTSRPPSTVRGSSIAGRCPVTCRS